MTTITVARLRELLHYDPETGIFTWKVKRKSAFPGMQVTTKHHTGYILIRIDGRQYAAHRLAWLYMTGQMPKDMMDHKNGIRSDNRLLNLREASCSQNLHNRGPDPRNKTGLKGARRAGKSRWEARISVDKKVHFLGSFRTPEEAHEAYKVAATKLRGEFANFYGHANDNEKTDREQAA